MNLIKSVLNRFLFRRRFDYSRVITILPKGQKVKGRILFSYLAEPLLWNKRDIRFNDHSNKWESREIARIFNRLGYIVDAIDYNNDRFYPNVEYDAIFDIHMNLQRLVPFLKKDSIKILHITGSYPRFSCNAELERIKRIEERADKICTPKRVTDFIYFDRSLRFADACSLIGDNTALKTFPDQHKKKINLVTVSISKLDYIKEKKDFVPDEKEFLWFFGSGAVHKGLDLVLDVFSKNKSLVLNVVGAVEKEKDFWKVFKSELTGLSNIRYHGHLMPSGKKFKEIIKRVFCFIAPSCSEGISPAVATCLSIGLFPIISKNTGVCLPKNCGTYLKNCSVEQIERAVLASYSMKQEVLEDQINYIQKYALSSFSRENFTKDMTAFITKALASGDVK